MDRLIEMLASGMGNSIGFAAESGILLIIFGLAWAAFAVGLVWSHGSIDAAWQWTGSLPLIAQAIVWLALLPVMAGMWIWQTSWPIVWKLTIIGSVAAWNLLVLLPRAAR